MPRPRYQLTDDDVAVVHRWVRERFRTHGWPEDWPSLTAWDRFPLDKPTTNTLQRWCDRFLDTSQWKQLQAVIRAARHDKSHSRTVHLSTRAHAPLRALAEREHLTLSAVIERYLPEATATPTAQAAHPTAAKQQATIANAAVTTVGQAPSPPKVMRVRLWLRVENNIKFVRGRSKACDEIERYVLSAYGMEQPHKDRPEYLLTIPYHTDEELDRMIDDILTEAANLADDRHCFTEADVQSVDDPDRSW
jgi:hypothetical protein